MHNPESVLENETQNESSNLGQSTRPGDSKKKKKINKKKKKKKRKKKRTCRIVDFTVLVDHRVKLKRKEEINTYTFL